jgi:hypothetical protein
MAEAFWEACQTMNGSWGYDRDNLDWKSVELLVYMLIDSVSKGGNVLLNVGPTARGEFDPRSVERLEGIGRWTRQHGRAIYGCGASAFTPPDDCRYTQNGDRLYLHIFQWPFHEVHLEGLGGKVAYAQFLHDAVLFQFTRPLQQNGTWSLYSLVLSGTGFEMPVSVRVAIFIACTGVVACILRRTEKELLTGLIVLGTVGAFVLPVDGFWSYFLLPIMVACALIPPMLLDFSQHADRGPSGTGGHPAGVANSGVHPQGISVQCTQTRSRASSDTPPVVLW